MQSDEATAIDQTAGPVFSLGHCEAARLLDTACTQRKLEFYSSNWPIVCHFFSCDKDNAAYIPLVQLINCNHNISFNSSVVSEIVYNYSKSHVSSLIDSKHMSNTDSDLKTFLALTDCTDGHAIEDHTQLLPLVQTAED